MGFVGRGKMLAAALLLRGLWGVGKCGATLRRDAPIKISFKTLACKCLFKVLSIQSSKLETP